MIDKQVIVKLESDWKTSKYYKEMTIISKSSKNRGSLIVSDKKAFSLDEIGKKLYENKTPKTADAIFDHNGTLIIVEIKTGFRDNIDLERDREIIEICEYLKEKSGEDYKCSAYYNVYKQYREKIKEELKLSVYAKALDSFMLLTNDIGYQELRIGNSSEQNVHFVLVIEDKKVSAMDKMIATYADVSKESTVELIENDNVLIDLRKSLSRLKGRGKMHHYLYDDVKVYTASEFKEIYGF